MSDVPRIAILGARGRMGQALAQLAQARGWTLAALLDVEDTRSGLDRALFGEADVVIEFTAPEAAKNNVLGCLRAGMPVVSGTTGWTVDDEVRAAVAESTGALLHAPNFSLGVHLFSRIAEAAGFLLSAAPGMEAHLIETHHAAKKDAPSGTARLLLTSLAAGLGRPVGVTSVRVGSVPGTHEILFDGAYEQIALTHVARDRRVFADGALTAAGWLRGRRGLYTLEDVLGLDGVLLRLARHFSRTGGP